MNSFQRQDLSVVLRRLMTWRREWSPADWQEACDRVRLELLDRQQTDQPAPTETGPLCESPGCPERALKQSTGPHGDRYYTGCSRHYALLGVKLADPAPQGAPPHDYATCEGCNPNPLKR